MKARELTTAEGITYALRYPCAASGIPSCAERTTTGTGEWRAMWACTRHKYHSGPHVGHIGDGSAVIIWGDEEAPTSAPEDTNPF